MEDLEAMVKQDEKESKVFWTLPEEALLEKYFTSQMTEMTLYEKMHKINPDRTYKAISRKLDRLREKGWTKNRDVARKKLRVGYLDIEATDLRADWGYMLTWFIKTKGKNEYVSGRITKDEIEAFAKAKDPTSSPAVDHRITRELLQAMKLYDVVWAHYGSDWRFDLPYIRTRAYANGLQEEMPHKSELFIKDTYPLAKKKLKLSSNRLGNIAELVGVKEKKSPVTPKMWQAARLGNKRALDYVYQHNKRDVEVLEKVHKKLEIIDTMPYASI